MLFAIYGLIAAAIFLVLFVSSGAYSERERRLRIPVVESKQRNKRGYLATVFGFLIPLSAIILRRTKLDSRIRLKMDAAHIPLTAAAFFNFKIILAVLSGLGGYFGFKDMPAITPGLALLGFFLPDIIVGRKIARRRTLIAKLLPETVDLLGLCVEAGLDLTTAIRWVVDKVPPNPLTEELAFLLEEIKWGKPRNQALKDMARRINLTEFFSFVHALVQSDRMGTPVAEAFAIISEDTRLHRFNRGERIALKAPIKILIPLIFCILPVIAIIVAGPIIIKFSEGTLTSGFSTSFSPASHK
ncbi:MAG: type II secretion system F family protein [Candidatus Omnitrophica bacterium]|nr:type II secretion system F family protein [Candidatus Omnitrophota bacterium]